MRRKFNFKNFSLLLEIKKTTVKEKISAITVIILIALLIYLIKK
nr:MAG TPA: Rifin [Caudoviricetes sp.]